LLVKPKRAQSSAAMMARARRTCARNLSRDASRVSRRKLAAPNRNRIFLGRDIHNFVLREANRARAQHAHHRIG